MSGLRRLECRVVDREAPQVDRRLLVEIHDSSYVEEVRRFCEDGGGSFDPDTYAVPASWAAALHAAGAGPCAVDALTGGEATTAFVAVRPPGHHAERHQAMGFCLFNNIAVTAAYLRSEGRRVAIVDWDVHHGNGTQNSFWSEPDVLYVSLHEFPFYPGTGWLTETGVGEGEGTTLNIPLPGGTSSDDYRAAFARVVVPVVRQFAPDWILVSAGYDAHVLDPLGGLCLESSDYRAMAGALAEMVPPQRIVAFLEGGYDLDALATASQATVEGVLGGGQEAQWPSVIDGSAGRIVDLVVERVGRYWDLA
ncbi:MAG: histone deacetylase [Actinomycetia bacterium]|nr:histone deacetylase [Actinomycetes bacterium]